jgi:hypothetical protein
VYIHRTATGECQWQSSQAHKDNVIGYRIVARRTDALDSDSTIVRILEAVGFFDTLFRFEIDVFQSRVLRVNLTPLEADTTYSIQIQAINEIGSSSPVHATLNTGEILLLFHFFKFF